MGSHALLLTSKKKKSATECERAKAMLPCSTDEDTELTWAGDMSTTTSLVKSKAMAIPPFYQYSSIKYLKEMLSRVLSAPHESN